jgi:hypothetical protein
VKLTYRDLVEEYVRLNQTTQPFAQIPHGRYINFMSDFLAGGKGATREQAIKAWETLKSLEVPKNYRAWTQVRSSKSIRAEIIDVATTQTACGAAGWSASTIFRSDT